MSIKTTLSFVLICVALATLLTGTTAFQAPSASFKRLEPRGFMVWIPHKPGISLFAFHGNLNRQMNGLEAGTWSVDITNNENGFWVYRNHDAVVNPGDRIYFWTYVLKDGLGYRQDNGVFYFYLTDLYNYIKGLSLVFLCLGLATLCSCNNGEDFQAPSASFMRFEPRGFIVWIPNKPGISLFAFHGNLNQRMNGLEAGNWSVDVLSDEIGFWAYWNDDAVVNLGESPITPDSLMFNDKNYQISQFNCNGCQNIRELIRELTISNDENVNRYTKYRRNILVSVQNRFASSPDYEFVMYVNDVPEIFQFENSVMHIKPIATANYYKEENPLKFDLNFGARCTGLQNTDECKKNAKHSPLTFIPPFMSAQLSTRNTLSFKYGRVEIRAKLPQTEWVVPELWLQPVTYAYGVTNYQSGQVRIVFSRTNGTSTDLYGGVILNSEEQWRYKKLCHLAKATDKNWYDNYHVFTLIWTEMYLAFAVDNAEYCRIHTLRDINTLPNHAQLSTGTKLAPFDQEFILTLGYGVGGHGDFSDNEKWITPKPWENTDPRAIPNFVDYLNHKHGDWLQNGRLSIDSVKVFSV
ncbi:gram-negative bacteria-binding protein 3-like [Teleopsis dalmanni]|uniref:gram-negative bacteria-binding protein 3-like n=1 Tax=Teleopsis dalmanni TaxID=139649 RepID=UPI0018CDF98B|nr:gram-negative bacteria-binding protein 3-like [Teleopsis dalmanni]